MSKFGDVLKKGWHPEKQGTTFKGQVVATPSHHHFSYHLC